MKRKEPETRRPGQKQLQHKVIKEVVIQTLTKDYLEKIGDQVK